jgi:signal transduction histidine kinase
MARLELATSGKTLGRVEGLAGLRLEGLRYMVRRGALTVVSIGALVAGLAVTWAAVEGLAYAEAASGPPGEVVTFVDPTGFPWQDGIRPGQRVLEVGATDDPGGWHIVTTDGHDVFRSEAAGRNAGLQATLPFGIAAVALASLALLFLRTRRRWVLPAASCALLAASVPALAQGGPDGATFIPATAAILSVVALALRPRLPRLLAIGIVAAAAALVGAWAMARLSGWPEAVQLEEARSSLALWATLVLVGDRVVLPTLAGEPLPVIRPRIFDIVVVAGFAATWVVLVNLLQLPLQMVAAVLLLALVFVPSTRRRFGEPLGRALLGDVREAAAAEAAEHERARLARELHDVPLQELVAVIRRLEILPGAEAESENLRALAGHLRNVATELRPPVLDDLGLPAALDFLAEETTTPSLPVRAEVVDDTGFGAERRPPGEVELAVYRIASEAVLNAIRHSGGANVQIRADVAPDRVELVVADDGAGVASNAARLAAKQKRLGLASMRRRAQAIDAELSIDGSRRGTQVRVVWQA